MLIAGVDVSGFQDADAIDHDDPAEAAMLRDLRARAAAYLASHRWAPPVSRSWLAYSVSGIIGLFLFAFERPVGSDEALWVVVGDLPSAYFVLDDAPDIAAALETYCGLMEDWAKAVIAGTALDDVFPVRAEANWEHARMLLSRVDFIRRNMAAPGDPDGLAEM